MAKSTSSNISIRMDADLKSTAEALFEELGMNLSTAFNIFILRKSIYRASINITVSCNYAFT